MIGNKVISSIWCQDLNNGIGYKNKLLASIPLDLKHFKSRTKNKVCIMGRKTLDSIIEYNGEPLPDRHTVVLTNDESYKQHKNVIKYTSFEKLIRDIESNTYPFVTSEDIVICGGAQIYELFSGFTDLFYITQIKKCYEKVDSYISNKTLSVIEDNTVSLPSCMTDYFKDENGINTKFEFQLKIIKK